MLIIESIKGLRTSLNTAALLNFLIGEMYGIQTVQGRPEPCNCAPCECPLLRSMSDSKH